MSLRSHLLEVHIVVDEMMRDNAISYVLGCDRGLRNSSI